MQLAGATNGNKHHVLTTMDKLSKLQAGCSQVQWEIINGTLSRLNMLLFSAANSLLYQKICLLQELTVQSTENIIAPSSQTSLFCDDL